MSGSEFTQPSMLNVGIQKLRGLGCSHCSQKMKKITLTLVSLSTLLLPVLALAQMQPIANGGYGTPPTSFNALINNIEMLMGLVFGGIAVVMFVIAGITFLTAQGDPEKVGSARMAFIWGVAGVIVGLIAFSIIAIVSTLVHP